MNPLVSRFGPYALALLAIIGAGWWLHHSGYKAGQAERQAYYKPIFDQIAALSTLTKARIDALKAHDAAQVADQEKTRAQHETVLQARLDNARRDLSRSVQDLAAARDAARAARTAPAAAQPSDAPGIAQCAGAIADALAAVGERAVRDAEKYGECQQFYNGQRDAQRAVLAH